MLSPDLIVALRLIKEGNNWVRPEENFIVVARETFDAIGGHCLIEIKREYLIDYLAARNLSLRLAYYRQSYIRTLQLAHRQIPLWIDPRCSEVIEWLWRREREPEPEPEPELGAVAAM